MSDKGSPDAKTEYFNKVYDDTFKEIKRFVAVKCADTSQISDILQEIYMEYYKMLLEKGISFAQNDRALIYKIAKRKVFRHYSQKQKLSSVIPLFINNDKGEEYCVADEESETREDDIIITHIDSERIWQIINGYPTDIRKIMYLYFCEQMSHSQIATALGYSISNVKNKLYRTLGEIREKENKDG